MRKRACIYSICLLIVLIFCISVQADAEPEEKTENKQTEEMASKEDPDLGLSSPSVLLMEESTGAIIYQKNADEQRSPASITKIMTLILIFDELEKGNLKLEDEVVTSTYAKSMGGSQVFLEEGEKQTVETMIKCIVIASGNDASVAMAEHIAGTESEFVRRMNERAKELGMNDTNFEDCCGLTDSANHYTSAHDVALMSRELIRRYPKILEYSSIWMEDITHVTARETKRFTLTNTNKLIRGYDGCIGLKTGSTQVAKYCVSAVAKRSEITLIAVVMGAPDYKVRFSDAAAMLNYGFGKCTLYIDANDEDLSNVSVVNGRKDQAAVRCDGEFRYLSVSGENFSEIEKEIELPGEVKAPVKKGEHAGRIVYRLKGTEIGSVAILYEEDVEKAGFLDYVKRALESFAQGAA
ncbi:MAG: D-alanyl-D-alanine carboxypeptidase family protein [Fusicatenibacter sp.]